ncbi:AAA family ATPase [Fredinandcohnia sp. QZ13]|uniref:ATP-binding protein n=1 Tax=Fredinandcohnia sp. QZ13 TaxID=3073144 RepID=UPI0028534DA3|nr:AAA family ATPase [Fredinandcohnia sp. QZ13]MDR4887213.1 AAA family ATPase [Fredinandcohnia sp. QZ13]
MRIIGIQIYGYGKLENVEIGNLSPALQVFYGQNEAGKSTLMSFIHSILFGFPTKQQNEQRYIPKTGSKYGGKLLLQTDEYGAVMVERLPGKAAGDVSVYLPDGTVRGEDFISELFQGMDKGLYQNVYSFNIHGLQGVHSLKSEDVGRFLFSAGTVGTDALLELQNKLTKEMDLLYKPKGKNPPLNMELNRLKDEHVKVSKWQEKNNEYEGLLEEQQRVENELRNLEARKHFLRDKIQESEKLQSIQPIVEEYQTLEYQLTGLPVYEPYPEDGLKRFEQLQALIKPYEAQLKTLQTKLIELEKEKSSIQLSLRYLENEQQIVELVENKSLFAEKQNRLQLVTKELLQIKEETKQLNSRLNLEISEERVQELDLSIAAKDLFSDIVSETARHKQQKHFLDDHFSKAKDALENSEHKLKELNKQILSGEEKEVLEKKKKQFTEIESLGKEKDLIEDEVNRINQQIQRVTVKEKENKTKLTRIFYGIGFAMLLAAVYFYISQEWLTGGILTVLALLMLPIGKMVTSQLSSSIVHALKDDRENLMKKLDAVQEKLKNYNPLDHEDNTARLLHDQQVKQQIEIEKVTLHQNERAYEKVLTEFEEWEKVGFSIDEKATNIKNTYGLPHQISSERLMDAFQILEAIRDKVLSKGKLLKQKDELQKELSIFHQKINEVAKQLNILDQDSIKIDQLAIQLQEEKRKYEQLLQIEAKLKDTTDQISELTLEIDHLQKECRVLWDMAEVSNEEKFRSKGQANEHAKEIKERMNILKSQLERFGELVDNCNVETNYQNWIEEMSAELNQLHGREKEGQRQLSVILHRVQELEEGGTYAEFLHSYEASKSMVKEHAKKWATLAIAKDILSKTVDQYRKLRLPKVIEKAEHYFSILTEKRYKKIYLDNEIDGFIVEDENGLRYKPNELSQATSEQLYMALRFSLANTMHPNQSYPFIIDDSFVNFDSNRLSSAVLLINELSKDNQVLLFTCHQHVMEEFKGVEPIKLGTEELRVNHKSVL